MVALCVNTIFSISLMNLSNYMMQNFILVIFKSRFKMEARDFPNGYMSRYFISMTYLISSSKIHVSIYL